MHYNYSLRFVLMPNVDVSKKIKDLVKFCKNAQINDVIFFIAAEDFHVGHVSKEMAKPYVDVILQAKAELDKIGVTTSLNPWCTLVHGDRGRKLQKGQNFRTMVMAEGVVANTVVCPLCENWREYYVDYLRYLIQEIQPKTVWLEDDFRLVGHVPNTSNGCFCEEHMKLYAKELSVSEISREEFVQGLLDNKLNYREVYAKVSKESMEDTLRYIVDGAGNLGSEISLMTGSGVGYHFEGRDFRALFNILSKYERPQHRMGLQSYRQSESHAYANLFAKTIFPTRAFIDDDLIVYSEIENAPMTRYIKSAKWTAFHMLATCPLLLSGATFDIFEFNGNGVTDAKLFEKYLSWVKPFLDKILSLGLKYNEMSKGINISILKNRCSGIDAVDNLEKLGNSDNYMGGLLAMLGGAVKYTEDAFEGDIIALLPTTVSILSNEQLIKLFNTKQLIIVNADVVEILIKRGLSNLLNVVEHKKIIERTGVHVYEQVAKNGICLNDELRASCQLFVGHYLKLVYGLDGEPEVLTKLYSYDYSFVGEGITKMNNVLIFPYYDSPECNFADLPYGLFHELRASAIRYAVNQTGNKDMFFSKNCMVLPFVYKKEDDYIIFVNYIEDEVEKLTFTSKENYTNILVCSVDNIDFKEVSFLHNGDDYILDYTMDSQSAIVLKLIK